MKIFRYIERARISLFWKISSLFLIVFVVLGICYLLITISLVKRYADETTQKLNAGVSSHMLKHVKPFVNGKVDEGSLERIMQSMMAVNPGLEVYLIDPEGAVLSSVVLHNSAIHAKVSVTPIKEFLKSDRPSLIYGDDPRNPGKSKIFSAAPIYERGVLQGYVYMILVSKEYDTITTAIQDSYLLKIGFRSFMVTLAATLFLSLLLLWWLLRSLTNVVGTVRKIAAGDLKARIPIRSGDDLAQLSVTINTMADTILKSMEDIKEVDKLRRDLIANVSHDIRTPLSIIHGYVETLILKEESLPSGIKTEYLQTIMKNTERLSRLVGALFELSQLESKQVVPKLETFFLSDLLHDLVPKYRLLAENRGISITIELAPTTPLIVRADLAMLERVLQNLIDNAIKYSGTDGIVRVVAEDQGTDVLLSVYNTGPGISSRDLPKIFDRYFKVGDSEFSHSTGLGLAIVKSILELHNSKIDVSSGLGLTIFSFRLPLERSYH